MEKKSQIFGFLDKLAPLIPIAFYWFDRNGVVMGGNDLCARISGAKSMEMFIGKKYSDVHSPEIAAEIERNLQLVVNSGQTIETEEAINDLSTNKNRYYLSVRSPLRDEDNVIVGIVATTIEITDKKEAERLKLETELQKTKIDEQEQFKKVTDQVVHDIRSPLASLLMVVKSCEKDIPETARVALREAAISIGDIANQLLSKYEKEEIKLYGNDGYKEELQPVMVALTVLQLLSEKKHQYKELLVDFSYSFSLDSNFAFIQAEPLALRRMMSNIINNAVESLEGKNGVISLRLIIENKHIKIVVQDDGKGMSQEVIDNIMRGIATTSDKKGGHGIGFVQIRETLERSHGKLAIDSKIGEGTKISLTFPIIITPDWIAKDITLNKGDTVIILDDDSSIHSAWKARFEEHHKDIILKHFTLGEETISFINNFPQKEKLFLLTDFELLKQDLNGLHVIERTGIKRAILVTSHYSNSVIRNLVIKSGAKILPKLLASEIPIEIKGSMVDESDELVASVDGKVDAVLVDDDKMFIDSLSMFFGSHNKVVAKYYNPNQFLKNISFYDKDTKIFLDRNFHGRVDGIEIAKKLHDMGYTSLYLLSGERVDANEIPGYLDPILKTDLDKLVSVMS